MPKLIHIRIAEPCHQKWNEMTPTQQGAFCHSCKKNVIDFTRKTENEIYDLVTQPGAQLCGRFTEFQLQQPVRKTEVKNGLFNWRAIAASLAGLLAFGKQATAGDLENKPKADTAQATAKTDTAAITTKTITSLTAKNDLEVTITAPKTIICTEEITNAHTVTTVGMMVAHQSPPVIADTTQHRLKGRVIEADTKEPLGYAAVAIKGTQIGALTDEDGYFDLGVDREQHKNESIRVSFVGYEQKEIDVADLKPDEPIVMEISQRTLMGVGEIVVIHNTLAEDQGGYNDITPWFERHKTRRINKGK